MTARKQRVYYFAASIQWPNATPPLDAVLDMIRYSGATLVSFGRREDENLFYMNMALHYTDMNLQSYREINQARWASFGFTVFWNSEYNGIGELVFRMGS